MNSNPLQKKDWGTSPSGAGVSPTLWVVIGALGLLALGGIVFNLSRVLSSSRPADPTSAPQADFREIKINSTLSLSEESGSFTIWGVPTRDGVICSRGEVFDLEYLDLSPDLEVLTDLQVRKEFSCGDGSGSFEMDLEVDILGTNTTGTWTITGGTGNYSGLTGSGTVEGTYLTEDLVVDSYTGTVTN